MAILQNRIVKSVLASETLVLSEGVDNAFCISMLLGELLINDHQKTIPIKLTKFVADKRLRIEIASIKEMLDWGEILFSNMAEV